MTSPSTLLRLLAGLLVLAGSSGCATLWHDLQPHRLHRLNRGPAPALDPEFSQSPPQTPPAEVATVAAVATPHG